MIEAGIPQLRRRLVGTMARPDFPIFAEFRAQGATDYYAQLVAFDIGERAQPTGLASSWISDAPDGFSDRDLAILSRLLPRYALVAKALLARQIVINVLATYIGPTAGRRVLAGEIRRGHMETIRAVLVYVDLRGFTEFSDRSPRGEIATTLDDYFDAMVAPVVARGGEVLKFLGDGCLMTFNLEGRVRDSLCSEALAAAIEMLARVRSLNDRRRANGTPVMGLDIVLHLGDVLYGNVGAADRLDFTVVGPAVNEASRIEALCKEFDRNLLVSEAFARAATHCIGRLESVGHHTLRGVSQAQEIFALKETG